MWYFWPHPSHGYSDVLNCDDGYHDWENLWTEWHQKECCSLKGRGCPEEKQVIDKVVHVPVFHRAHNHYVPVPVPSPPHIVYKNRYVHLPPKIIYEPRIMNSTMTAMKATPIGSSDGLHTRSPGAVTT